MEWGSQENLGNPLDSLRTAAAGFSCKLACCSLSQTPFGLAFLSLLRGCFLEWRCGKFGLSKLLLQGPSLLRYAGPSEPCWVVYAGRWSWRRSWPVVLSLWFLVNGYYLLFILATLLWHRTFTNPIHGWSYCWHLSLPHRQCIKGDGCTSWSVHSIASFYFPFRHTFLMWYLCFYSVLERRQQCKQK